MQLRRLQTLPYLTNQPFDVPTSEAGCGSVCQMKIGAGRGFVGVGVGGLYIHRLGEGNGAGWLVGEGEGEREGLCA